MKKIPVLLLILVVSISVISFPRRTDAQLGGLIVHDPLNYIINGLTAAATVADKIKGYTLDPLAWALAKATLQSVVKGTVNSINKGPNGSPQYVTNLGSTLNSTANAQADQFLQQLSTNGAIKSPFQSVVASSLTNTYNQTANGGFFAAHPYTLNKTTPNDSAFLAGGFNNGGFDSWMSTIMNPANNPYGASMLADQELGDQVSGAVTNKTNELNWAKGINSYKGNCGTPTTTAKPPTPSVPGIGSSAQALATLTSLTSLNSSDKCLNASIQTPGTVIEAQLEKSLGSGIDTLVNAHTFDEIIGSVLSQLVNQVVGSGGLFGASQPSPTTSGTTYFNQPDPATASSTATLSVGFTQTVTTQVAQLQTFANEWGSLAQAAQSAATALSSSTCYPNAQLVLANTVKPVITQAAAEISKAQVSITAITKIQAELPSSSASTATPVQISQASTDYSTLLASGTLPSSTEVATAQANTAPITETGTTTPSLLVQLQQITQQAQICSAPTP